MLATRMALRMVDRLEELQRRRQYLRMHEGSFDEDIDDVPFENSSFVVSGGEIDIERLMVLLRDVVVPTQERGFGTGYRLSMVSDAEPKQSARMLTFFSIVSL